MKKSLLWLLPLLFCLAACSPEQNGGEPEPNGADDTYTNLPVNFTVDFDWTVVPEAAEAPIITAQTVKFDKDDAVDIFLTRPDETEFTIEGSGYTYRMFDRDDYREMLVVHLSGRYEDVDRVSVGSLRFSRWDPETFFNPVVRIALRSADGYDALRHRLSILPMEKEVEFAGISLAATREKFEDILQSLNLPMETLRPWLTYSMTEAEQRVYYPLVSTRVDPLTDREQGLFSDGYALAYRQYFADIPVITSMWNGYAEPPSYPQYIHGSFSANGLTEISIGYVLQPQSQTEARPLLSLAEAFTKLKEVYGSVILEEPVRVIGAELCYLSGENTRVGTTVLYPAWVFTYLTDRTSSGREWTHFHVFDAFSGEKILNAGAFVQ